MRIQVRQLAGITVLTVLLGLSPGRPVEAGNRLNIVTSEFAPYNYLENGSPTGFCTDVVKALLQKMGLRAAVTTLPWARAYQTALKQPATLIFTIARTPERENLFYWIGVLVTGKSYLFSLKSRHLRLTSLDQARPMRIGASRGGIRAKFITGFGILGLDLVSHSRMNAVKLMTQRIDLWAEDELTAVYTVRQLGYDPGDILSKALFLDIVPPPEGYLAISRDTDPSLVAALKTAYAELLRTPGVAALKSRYFHPGP